MKNRKLFALMALITASLVVNLGFTSVSPVFPHLILALKGLLKELPELVLGVIPAHRGAIEFGILMAAFMATRAPIAVIAGALSDVVGRRKLVVFGMAIYLVVSLGFYLSNDFMFFTLFRALQGVASAMVWPAAEAYIADLTTVESRGKAISAYVATMSIAEVIGPAIGVVIYKWYITVFGPYDVIAALKSPFAFLVVSSAFSLILLSTLPKVQFSKVERRIIRGFQEIRRRLSNLPKAIALSIKALYINGSVNGISMGIMSTVVIAYIIEEVTKDPANLGILFLASGAVGIPVTLFAGYVSDKMGSRKPLILLGYLIARPMAFIIPLIKDFLLLLFLTMLFSLAFSLSMPLMRALQADLIESDVRGTVFGFQQLFFNSGVIIGALLGSFLCAYFAPHKYMLFGLQVSGYIVPFWIVGFLGIITTIIFILYVVDIKQRGEQR